MQPHPVSYSGGRRLNDSTSIQSVIFSQYGLTIVRENVCNKAKNVKSRFWILEKRKIRILERWC